MRYLRNKPIISEEKQKELEEKKIAILGMGGLGGYLAQGALRIGIRHLVLVDGDCFSQSNLNRQLFSTEESIGREKVNIAKDYLLKIDSKADIVTHNIYIKDINDSKLFKDVDLILDALDNIESRYLLQDICNKLNIPLIHGAIQGYYGQYAFLESDKNRMKYIYRGGSNVESLGNLSFVASMIASYQLLLMLQYFLNDPALLKNQLVRLDIRNQERTVIPLD